MKNISLKIAVSILALNTAQAHAQTSASTADSVDTTRIEEIVVTAQRRSESLQSVPVSVTALTSNMLQRSGIVQTSDLQVVTPGLTWSTGLSVPTPFMRGVGSRDNSAANESAVATYIDGVYFPAMPGALLSLPNIERIEVLKGPQGTLFGRNANGGLIQIITKDPPSSFSGKASAGYANYDTVSGQVYLGGPISDTLGADLSLYYTNQHDGWGRNLFSGRDVNVAKDFAARTKFVLTPADETRIVVSLDFDHRRGDIGSAGSILPGSTSADGKCGAAPFPAGYPGCAPQPSTTKQGGFYDTQTNVSGYTGKNGQGRAETKQGGGSISVEQDVAFAVLRSISAYRHLDNFVYADNDLGPVAVSQTQWKLYDRTFTQELQLTSQDDSKLKWIVGGFYMHRKVGYDYFRAVGYSVGLPSPLDPAGQCCGPGAFGGRSDVISNVMINSYSGFAQATAEVLAETNVTVGARYTSDKEHYTSRQLDVRGTQRAAANVRKTWSKLTYRFAVDHHFTPSTMAYVSYNRGFKAGLFNTTNSAGQFADPETLDAIEVGVKSDLLDRRLRVNLAAFNYDYKDVQLPVLMAGATRTINAAKAKIQGLEFEVVALPVDRLTLSAGGSFLTKSEYQDFPNGPVLTPNGRANSQTAANLAGNRTIRSPKFNGNVALDYSVLTDMGSIAFNMTYYYNSGFYFTPDNNFRQERYGLLNTQVYWKTSDDRFGLRLWARNLLDKKHLNNISPSTLSTFAVPAEPRTYGITGEWNF
jgi:iron complex outermembrane receptor protein